jgi:hypothetical protein
MLGNSNSSINCIRAIHRAIPSVSCALNCLRATPIAITSCIKLICSNLCRSQIDLPSLNLVPKMSANCTRSISAQFSTPIAPGIAPIELIERRPMRFSMRPLNAALNPASKMSAKLRDLAFLCICKLTARRALGEVDLTSLPFVSTAGRRAASPEAAFAFSTPWRQVA